jgi:hypothetical protein
MTFHEHLPVSDMARSRANRFVDEIFEEPDEVERTAKLIGATNTALEVMEGFDGGPLSFFADASVRKGYEHGVRVAIRTLLNVGGPEFVLPTEQLRSKALAVELRHSILMEASMVASGGDIADMYYEEDGGTASNIVPIEGDES